MSSDKLEDKVIALREKGVEKKLIARQLSISEARVERIFRRYDKRASK